MAPRVLSPKEQKVLESFSKLKPVSVDASQVSFGGSNDLYSISDPVIYQIPNSNYHLVFGDIKRAMSMDQMKMWLEEQLKTRKIDNDENVIDGEEQDHDEGCSEGCSHQHETPTEEPKLEANDDDINLIMGQFNISREEAAKALSDSNNDVVNALVELGKNK